MDMFYTPAEPSAMAKNRLFSLDSPYGSRSAQARFRLPNGNALTRKLFLFPAPGATLAPSA